jgi:hypothetical protein
MSLSHVWLISPIGHVYVELKLEVSTEQVKVEDFTNLDSTQGNPGAFNQYFLSIILNLAPYSILIVH